MESTGHEGLLPVGNQAPGPGQRGTGPTPIASVSRPGRRRYTWTSEGVGRTATIGILPKYRPHGLRLAQPSRCDIGAGAATSHRRDVHQTRRHARSVPNATPVPRRPQGACRPGSVPGHSGLRTCTLSCNNSDVGSRVRSVDQTTRHRPGCAAEGVVGVAPATVHDAVSLLPDRYPPR